MPVTSLLGVLLVLPVLPQDPKADAKAVDAVQKPISDREARTLVAEFKRAARNKDARLAERIEAVQALGSGQNKLLVKPLATVVEKDESLTVRKTAAVLLGHQPAKQAHGALIDLIEDPDQPPEVLAALVTSLTSAGYTSRDWKKIEALFERDFGEKYTPVQQAILQLITVHEEKRAWKLLVEHVGEPAPTELQPLSNPPAEYWKRRWEAWRIWRANAVEALFVISGQRFSSKQEAVVWIRENGAKVGLK